MVSEIRTAPMVENALALPGTVEVTLEKVGYRVLPDRVGQELPDLAVMEMPGAVHLAEETAGMNRWRFARRFWTARSVANGARPAILTVQNQRWMAALVIGLGLVSLSSMSREASSVAAMTPVFVAVVQGYVDTWQPDRDPLIRMAGGFEVKASNYYGITVAGTLYYYRVVHSQSFDPKSRGERGPFVAVSTLEPGTLWEVEIYQWNGKPHDDRER